MKILLLPLVIFCLANANADQFSEREAASKAALDAQYRKDMNDIKESMAPLSRILVENMAAPHGGVAKFTIRVKSDFNDSNVYGDVNFSTQSGLVCKVMTVITYNCITADRPGCPGQLPAAWWGCECYDPQNRRLFLNRDGTINY